MLKLVQKGRADGAQCETVVDRAGGVGWIRHQTVEDLAPVRPRAPGNEIVGKEEAQDHAIRRIAVAAQVVHGGTEQNDHGAVPVEIGFTAEGRGVDRIHEAIEQFTQPGEVGRGIAVRRGGVIQIQEPVRTDVLKTRGHTHESITRLVAADLKAPLAAEWRRGQGQAGALAGCRSDAPALLRQGPPPCSKLIVEALRGRQRRKRLGGLQGRPFSRGSEARSLGRELVGGAEAVLGHLPRGRQRHDQMLGT
jgi:hypothetical protein